MWGNVSLKMFGEIIAYFRVSIKTGYSSAKHM